MAYGGYRRNDLAYGDDYEGGERWDRDRFERQKTYAPREPVERETFRAAESDRNTRGGERREITIDERIERRNPGGRYDDRNRLYEEERAQPRRRPQYLDDDPPRRGGEVAPYRQQKWPVAEYDIPIRAAPRPVFHRRQSSLDTYDRRPVPRYDDDDRAPPAKYREVIRYRDPKPIEEDREERYREVRIRRERERSTRRATRIEESSDSFEEVLSPSPPPVKAVKRGRTKFPKRLAQKRVIVDLGYPFEEDEDFFVVRAALGKDQIDEVITRSERYRESALPKALEAPPLAEPDPLLFYPPPVEPTDEIIQTRTTKIIENPTPEEYAKYAEKESSSSSSSSESEVEKIVRTKKSRKSTHSRRRARSSHRTVEEDEEFIGGPLAVVVPERRRKSERDIQAEIRSLELEKKALKLEREAEQRRARAEKIRESEYEVVNRKDRGEVRVEKDRRGKSKPSKRAVEAALFTLT